MMLRWISKLSLVILFILLITPTLIAHGQGDCSDSIQQLTQTRGWQDELANPIITSESQLNDKLKLYESVYKCRQSTPALATARRQIEYFLVFAGGAQVLADESYLTLVSFASSDDPAVKQIRDEANIPAPNGYVYVRTYHSRKTLPFLVKRAFSKDGVAGVTMGTRYIAVLQEYDIPAPKATLQARSLPKTISHELVHAYINSVLGPQNKNKFREWFHEGVAIYFSGSDEVHAVVTSDSILSLGSPEDYRQYTINFQYLEAKLGRGRLLQLIKESLQKVDERVIYRAVEGITSARQLATLAYQWDEEQRGRESLVKLAIGVAICGILGLLVWLVLLRDQPNVQCPHCGYAGKKADFADRHCPRCKHFIPSGKASRYRSHRI